MKKSLAWSWSWLLLLAATVGLAQVTAPRWGDHSASASGPLVYQRKSRGSYGSPTTVLSGDYLGEWCGAGYDGTDYRQTGCIAVVSEGTIGANRVPSKIVFSTGTDASPSVKTARMQINSVGLISALGGSLFSGPLTGNASTATALAANPTDCGTGEFANAIAASGNLTCAVPGGNVVTAESYGAVGDGTTDDTTAIQNAITAVAGMGKTLLLSKTYKITAGLTAASGNFTLDGGGTIKPVATGTTAITALQIAGSTSNTTGSASTYSKTTRSTTTNATADFDSVAGYAVGDFTRLIFNDGLVQFSQVGIVTNIAGTTVTLNSPILIPLDAIDTGGIVEVTPAQNVRIRNLTFDASASTSTGDHKGLELNFNAYAIVENLKFVNFTSGANTVGFATSTGYGNTYRNLTFYKTGSNGSASMSLWYETGARVENVQTIESPGFGFLMVSCTQLHVSRMSAIKSAGRGIKPMGVAYSDFYDLEAIAGASTGLHWQGGTYRSTFRNVRALRNADTGMGSDSLENQYNLFDGVVSMNNTNFDLSTATEDSYFTFRNLAIGVLSLLGTNNTTERGPLTDRGDPSAWDKAVGDFIADATWRDLDLSAIVPAGAGMILLRVDITNNTAGQYIQFRKKGNSNGYNTAILTAQVSGVQQPANLTALCNGARVVQYYASNGGTWAAINLLVRGWQ